MAYIARYTSGETHRLWGPLITDDYVYSYRKDAYWLIVHGDTWVSIASCNNPRSVDPVEIVFKGKLSWFDKAFKHGEIIEHPATLFAFPPDLNLMTDLKMDDPDVVGPALCLYYKYKDIAVPIQYLSIKEAISCDLCTQNEALIYEDGPSLVGSSIVTMLSTTPTSITSLATTIDTPLSYRDNTNVLPTVEPRIMPMKSHQDFTSSDSKPAQKEPAGFFRSAWDHFLHG